MIKKTPSQRVRPECSKLIPLYQTEGYLRKCTDELNDNKGKIKEKVVRAVVTTWGPEQREVPGLKPTEDMEFMILNNSKTP